MPHKRSIKERLLKGGAWALAGRLGTALSGIAINFLLARLLTPEEMGSYFLTLSLVSIATIVAQLGLTQTVVRLVAESMGADRPGRARKSVLLVIRTAAFSGIIVACLLAFGVGQWIAERLFNSEIMSQVMGLAAVWVVIRTLQELVAEVYRGFHDIKLAVVFGGLTTSVLSMLFFVVLWLLQQGHGDLKQIIILSLGAGLSSVLISIALLWNKLSSLPSSKDKVELSEILRISWPLWITNLTLFMLIQADLWILGLFRSPEEVAVYGVASRIVALIGMPLVIVNSVVPPLISEMYSQGRIKDLENALRTMASMAGLLAIVVLVPFVIFGGAILAWLFGDYYEAGGIVLAILCVGQLANVWSGSCGQVLMLTGNQAIMMKITLLCGVTTVLVAWWLVRPYGGVGVAVAFSGGMFLQNLFMLLLAKRKTDIWTHMSPMLVNKFGVLK